MPGHSSNLPDLFWKLLYHPLHQYPLEPHQPRESHEDLPVMTAQRVQRRKRVRGPAGLEASETYPQMKLNFVHHISTCILPDSNSFKSKVSGKRCKWV